MRFIVVCLLGGCAAYAQFKSTVPLVIAPATITDSKGRFVDGLTAADLILYDNNVAQTIQVEPVDEPISLVVAIQASSSSVPVLDKLGQSGILLSQLLAGNAGETALVSFSDDVRVLQDFTADPDRLTYALRDLRAQGGGAATLEGLMQALRMLRQRKPGERRVILMIGESRDRSSKVQISDVMLEAQRQNASIYWLTYSTFLTPFTNRQKTVGERKKQADRGKDKEKDAEMLPPDMAPGSLLSVFTELAHKSTLDAAALLSRTTGARTISFLKQSALEEAIRAVGEEVHRQYMVSFQPAPSDVGEFHSIQIEVKGRPELRARTRSGYWAVP
jgi:VWFA-related protein